MMAGPHFHRRARVSEYGPTHPLSDQVHAEKYRGPGESFPEAMNRIASALSDDEQHYREFREVIRNMRFLPAGRVQAAMGSSKRVTPYNCFVSGLIEDSFTEGHGSIMGRAREAAQTMRMGGGIGYDFSTLRPNGALIRKLGSRSSGPVSFMEIFDAICRCVASSGHRRGAQMGVLRIDHPDIEEFIHAKQNSHRLTGFNISVAVTDQFMECLVSGKPFPLVFEGETQREVDPAVIWETLMRSTWDWAEPGVLFIDQINRMNNLWYCEKIAATNPCGEQPLPPYGACLLGSFNLTKYITVGSEMNSFDFEALRHDIFPVVRAMDNVIDRATYPLYEQEQEAKNKRRMGLGITGLANAAEAISLEYGSPQFCDFLRRVLATIRDESYTASAKLAILKGPFKLFDNELYTRGKFFQTLPEHIQQLVKDYGIRNSHLTSIAPTGTISLTADNISSGIEPVFAREVRRIVNMSDGQVEMPLRDYALEHLGIECDEAADISVDQHLSVLIEASKHVDSAVSKTLNVPHDTPWDQFKDIYVRAWEGGAKGCTTYTSGGKREGILKVDDEPELACRIDSETGRRECE